MEMVHWAVGSSGDGGDRGKVVTDEGLSNAVCTTLLSRRKFTGETVDAYEKTVLAAGSPAGGVSYYSPSDTQHAVSRALQCVVGMQEHWASTLDVVALWFPWAAQALDPHHR
jgi:hypothetical protein